ncbi:DUF3261 domain-containing protein [Alteromonas sp. 14N.309.X.WAT.G.H12]|uniref:DUF3261 domain-containing protein n=1 Tax=Alteromonas sp. 14N.309.X.WAT.G.H12 TaxID=3120824 RepID=UPI002FD1690D
MRHFSLFVVFLTGLCLLGGCVSSPSQSKAVNEVSVSDGVQLRLSSPPEVLWGESRTEVLTAYYNNEQKQAMIQTEFSDGHIALAAFTLSGVPIMTMVWQETAGTKAKTYFEVENLTPSFIIADLQLALWPIAELDANLEGENVSLHRRENNVREITKAGEPVIRIQKSDNKTIIFHLDKGYKISLETVK